MSSSTHKRQKQRKVLLMGKSGAGKSSMRSIIFENYVAKDVRRLGATIDIDRSNIKFMGNLELNLWDCGGQTGFTDNFLTGQRSDVFDKVAVLIYVFNVESREFSADLIKYSSIITALKEYSPNARIFVLIHKMDLINPQRKDAALADLSAQIQQVSNEAGFGDDSGSQVEFWGTSIWDQSLYKAWTQVIYRLVPNARAIEALLEQLAGIIHAHELVLYERRTCLMVTHVSRSYESSSNPFADRFEKLSSILKSHKQSVAKHTNLQASEANFAELQIKTTTFTFFITRLTETTNLAVVLPPGESYFNSARINITLARDRFANLDIAGKPVKSEAQKTLQTAKENDDGRRQLVNGGADR